MKKKSTSVVRSAVLALPLFGISVADAAFLSPQVHHPGEFFEKYATPLPYFDGSAGPNRVTGPAQSVSYEEFRQHVLPETFYNGGGPNGLVALQEPYIEGTQVWGYNIGGTNFWPGVTIEATRGIPTTVTYANNLGTPLLQLLLTIDQTIHWANPLEVAGPPASRLELPPYAGPQPVLPHLHGAEVPSSFDGHPSQWWTTDGIRGSAYRSLDTGVPPSNNEATYQYPNSQESATLWTHDHTLGITRINVYAGVAAYYFLRDPVGLPGPDIVDDGQSGPGKLPTGSREVEFVIQDRMFDINGNLLFPDGPPFFVPNAQHPFWNPEFLGDVTAVNGRTWPYLAVDGQRYRIRFLNGSNARFYNLSLSGGGGGKGKGKGNKDSGASFWVIGTDGGLLDDPVQTGDLLIAPGERYDVIVDFAGLEGQTLTLSNDAKAPYPFGATADPKTVGQIAQFIVNGTPVADNTYDPALDGALRTTNLIDRLVDPVTGTLAPGVAPVRYRQLTLNETPGLAGPLDAVLNNTRWGGVRDDFTATSSQGLDHDTGTVAGLTDYLTEMPQLDTTEVWEIINLTGDAHPIHLHLVQFQVLNRQTYSVRKYTAEYERNYPGGAAANPNQGIFIPHFGPPLGYNIDQCNTGANPDCSNRANPAIPVIGGNPLIDPYLTKGVIPPEAYEAGWKDTVIALPKQVTRIAIRWADQSNGPYGSGAGGPVFDPTAIGNPIGGIVGPDGTDGSGEGGPGYVWHCHILDHEDNEMMRPYTPVNNDLNEL